jgi:hypothetical protein
LAVSLANQPGEFGVGFELELEEFAFEGGVHGSKTATFQ